MLRHRFAYYGKLNVSSGWPPDPQEGPSKVQPLQSLKIQLFALFLKMCIARLVVLQYGLNWSLDLYENVYLYNFNCHTHRYIFVVCLLIGGKGPPEQTPRTWSGYFFNLTGYSKVWGNHCWDVSSVMYPGHHQVFRVWTSDTLAQVTQPGLA